MAKSPLEHALQSPHFEVKFGKPLSKNQPERRKPLSSEPGILDSVLGPSSVGVRSPDVQEPAVIRKPWFQTGTWLYAFVLDAEHGDQVIIPRDAETESDLRREQLMFDTQLKIDPEEGMEMGARGKPIIRNIGKSNYGGAFTVVRYPVDDGKGKVVEELRLVDLNRRRKRKANVLRRFARANQ